jgi:hypothetical protein
MFEELFEYLPFILSIPIILAVLVLLWIFVMRPRIQLPLLDEEDEGIWRIPLPQLGKMNEGRVTTARRTFQAHFGKLIDTADPGEREKFVKLRDLCMQFNWFAQRIGRSKVMYAFDKDPLQPSQHMRDDIAGRFGGDTPVRFVYNVKDCLNLGQGEDGFEYVGVKLGIETTHFTDDERSKYTLALDTMKVVQVAAANKESVKHFKQLADSREQLVQEQYEQNRKVASERDNAYSALSQKPLTAPDVELGRGGLVKAIAKNFFSWQQIALATFAYILIPNIMKYFSVSFPEPSTVSLLFAIIIFFLWPVVKGLFRK